MSTTKAFVTGSVILVAAFGMQFRQIQRLKREVAELRTEVTAPPAEVKPGPSSATPNPADDAVQMRLTQLERWVANLAKPARAGAMANSPAELSEEEYARLGQQLLDPSAADADRLKAVRTLRRNNKLGDEAMLQTLNLLQTSTNANVRRELLQHLEGLTNAALKQPLIALLNAETDNGTREQLVNSLRRFADDPTVEKKLWDVALNDANTRVRDQAREALARAPATPERVEQLLTRATSADASLDERLVSFRALRLAKSQTPELVSELASMAQNSTDPIARAKLFKSFNGLTDPSLMLPLVSGLQDTDPVVRQNAANALSEFPDPRVQEWLTHLIQNDADPAVKREAHAALEHSQRLSRKSQ